MSIMLCPRCDQVMIEIGNVDDGSTTVWQCSHCGNVEYTCNDKD